MKPYFTIEQLAVRSMKGYFTHESESHIISGKPVDIWPTEVSALIQEDEKQKTEIADLKHKLQITKEDSEAVREAIYHLPDQMDKKTLAEFKEYWSTSHED